MKYVLGALLFVVIVALFLIEPRKKSYDYPSLDGVSAEIWQGYRPEVKQLVALRLLEIEEQKSLEQGALFVGDSITEWAPLDAMFPGVDLANYGIVGGTTEGLLLRLDQIQRNTPSRIFILIGTNDFSYGHTADQITGNILSVVGTLKRKIPTAEFYVVSVLPREVEAARAIESINITLKENAQSADYVFLDLGALMRADDGALRQDVTQDGLHLNETGYALWAKAMRDCVTNGCEGLATQ